MLGRLREGAKAPQASQARASSPLRGAPFCAGFARVKASSHSGEVVERSDDRRGFFRLPLPCHFRNFLCGQLLSHRLGFALTILQGQAPVVKVQPLAKLIPGAPLGGHF